MHFMYIVLVRNWCEQVNFEAMKSGQDSVTSISLQRSSKCKWIKQILLRTIIMSILAMYNSNKPFHLSGQSSYGYLDDICRYSTISRRSIRGFGYWVSWCIGCREREDCRHYCESVQLDSWCRINLKWLEWQFNRLQVSSNTMSLNILAKWVWMMLRFENMKKSQKWRQVCFVIITPRTSNLFRLVGISSTVGILVHFLKKCIQLVILNVYVFPPLLSSSYLSVNIVSAFS